MTDSRSTLGEPGGRDAVRHADILRPLRKCTPADLRGSAQREARRRIALARRALGLTQESFAARLGCSVDSVERWEAGKVAVPGWAVVVVGEWIENLEETGT
jgi:hypothetical protein